MSTTKTSAKSKSVSKTKGSTPVSSKPVVEVDPIAAEVKRRYASGHFGVNQLAAQFMVHTSRIEKILGK